MTDRYATFAHTRPGHYVVRRLGLPDPPHLRRYETDDPEFLGPVLLGGGGRLSDPVRKLLATTEVLDRAPDSGGPASIVFDATGITTTDRLRALYDFFHPVIRSLRPCGRVVVLGTPARRCASVREATAQRAVEGFVRSLGKEVGRGSTVQLVTVEPGAETRMGSTIRFLLSGRSAYVSGQVIPITTTVSPTDGRDSAVADGSAGPGPGRSGQLRGMVAVVTGSARGIGAAIARVLARDGAQLVCVDLPSAGQELARLVGEVRGSAVQLDLTGAEAPDRLASWITERHGSVGIFVHNAGVTRDRTLARMRPAEWDTVLDVNLTAQERINEVLLDRGLLADGGRLISVASVAGIAGNRGQTNYAASKAGVIGLVEALAPSVAGRGITVNGVAPGFIETAMTATMPAAPRTVGRRLNSLAQGGQPVDVAETIGWLADPTSEGITGVVVRVCGQSFLGA